MPQFANADSQPVPELWLDQPDALARLERSDADQGRKSIARDIITDGFAIIRAAVDPGLCDRVVRDYAEYSEENRDYVDRNVDAEGREKRLVNFHWWSDAEMQIGCNPRTMEILDFLFGREAAVYTSLTFKYGTQQPIHRDTPHFATWPESYFFGVWTALEDVQMEAGPLQYIPGGQFYKIDQASILQKVKADFPNESHARQLELALDIYNGEVITRSPQEGGPLKVAPLKKGDTAIWHPQLPHGGFPASDPSRSRWSVVFHCAPSDVQVYQHDTFFTHKPGDVLPPRYGFREAYGRKIAVAGDTAFM